MAAPVAVPLIAAGIGALGSIAGGILGKPKKPKFKPFQISGVNGGVNMDKKGLTTSESVFNSGARRFFQDQFGQFSGDPMGQGQYGQELINRGQTGFMPAFMEAQNAGFDMSNAGLFGHMQGLQGLQGMFGGMGGMGMDAAFGSPTAAGQTDMANNMAGSMFSQFGNFDQLASQRKAGLDSMAIPQEQQAAQSAMQGLFNSGRLGTTGGANQFGQLAQAHQMADNQRGLMSQDFARQQQAQMLGLGSQFFGQGLQGTGLDQSRGLQLGNMTGQFFNQMPGLQDAQYGAMVGADTRNISRAGHRLENMQGLFGFGNQMMENPIGQASRALGAIDPLNQINNTNIDQALAGAALRSRQGPSGPSAVKGSIGGMLSGFGAGMMNRGMDSFFNRGSANPSPDSQTSSGSTSSGSADNYPF